MEIPREVQGRCAGTALCPIVRATKPSWEPGGGELTHSSDSACLQMYLENSFKKFSFPRDFSFLRIQVIFLQLFIFNSLFRHISVFCFQYYVSLILMDYRGGKKANKLLQGHFVFDRRKGPRRCNAMQPYFLGQE